MGKHRKRNPILGKGILPWLIIGGGGWLAWKQGWLGGLGGGGLLPGDLPPGGQSGSVSRANLPPRSTVNLAGGFSQAVFTGIIFEGGGSGQWPFTISLTRGATVFVSPADSTGIQLGIDNTGTFFAQNHGPYGRSIQVSWSGA